MSPQLMDVPDLEAQPNEHLNQLANQVRQTCLNSRQVMPFTNKETTAQELEDSHEKHLQGLGTLRRFPGEIRGRRRWKFEDDARFKSSQSRGIADTQCQADLPIERGICWDQGCVAVSSVLRCSGIRGQDPERNLRHKCSCEHHAPIDALSRCSAPFCGVSAPQETLPRCIQVYLFSRGSRCLRGAAFC